MIFSHYGGTKFGAHVLNIFTTTEIIAEKKQRVKKNIILILKICDFTVFLVVISHFKFFLLAKDLVKIFHKGKKNFIRIICLLWRGM